MKTISALISTAIAVVCLAGTTDAACGGGGSRPQWRPIRNVLAKKPVRSAIAVGVHEAVSGGRCGCGK